MLYGDYIDTRTDTNPHRASAWPRVETAQLIDGFLRAPAQEVSGGVDAHGTGVSTGARSRSFTFALSVLGNVVVGGLFLGGLFLAPRALSLLMQIP